MITCWSSYTGAGQTDGGGRLVIDYLTAQAVEKNLSGQSILLRRDPLPEPLLGHPDLVVGMISVLPFKHRYTAATLSFAASDIDVTRFNAGDPQLRRDVGRILDLFVETAFVGIPPAARPSILANTHTHTGRLELNVVIPRALRHADGKILAFNPYPPGSKSRHLWDAFTDTVNGFHGFADPRDAGHMRWTSLPDDRLKLAAEARRNGVRLPSDPRASIAALACEYYRDGGIRNRDALLRAIMPEIVEWGILILSTNKRSVTFEGPKGEHWRVGGHLFSDLFSELNPIHDLTPFECGELRRNELRRAPDRLRAALARRAAFHAERRHGDAPVFDPLSILRQGPGRPDHGCPAPHAGQPRTPILSRLSRLVSHTSEILTRHVVAGALLRRISRLDRKPFASSTTGEHECPISPTGCPPI